MITKTTLEELDQIFLSLEYAYETAGQMRDTFTGINKNENELKQFCNDIRGSIYNLRQKKLMFRILLNESLTHQNKQL